MRVKVGLVTSSCEAALKASAIPFTMVVFPAPRSPRNRTSFGGASSGASFRPRAIVSSAEFVLYSRVAINGEKNGGNFRGKGHRGSRHVRGQSPSTARLAHQRN